MLLLLFKKFIESTPVVVAVEVVVSSKGCRNGMCSSGSKRVWRRVQQSDGAKGAGS